MYANIYILLSLSFKFKEIVCLYLILFSKSTNRSKQKSFCGGYTQGFPLGHTVCSYTVRLIPEAGDCVQLARALFGSTKVDFAFVGCMLETQTQLRFLVSNASRIFLFSNLIDLCGEMISILINSHN